VARVPTQSRPDASLLDAQSDAPLAAVFAQLRTTDQGLSGAEVRRRLAVVGPNDPVGRSRFVILRELLRFVANPLVAILLAACLVSAAVGEEVNAVIIAVLVLFSVVLNFVQSFRSQRAAAQLRAMVTLTATVRRDGAWLEVPQHELVPGDIIRLAAGNLVPADARLIESRDLHLQEAALTGESLPAEKEAIASQSTPIQEAAHASQVFLGTSVVSGSGVAVVVRTGRATMLGHIATRLATRAPENEFERGTRQFGLLIMYTVFFLVLFVLLVSLAAKHDPLESFLFAIALAVGLTPEFLPMITTVTLAQGAVQMAHQGVIVKRLPAMQNFGSMDILCSDKTGTLTSGDMRLEQCVDPLGQASPRVFLLAALNSQFETGIKSPLDAAILAAAPPDTRGYRKLDEVPFDFVRRRLSVVVAEEQTAVGAELGERLLITKGAPEGVLEACGAYEVQGERRPFDEASRARCLDTFQQFSAQGSRVLAVAWRPVPPQDAYRAADEVDLTLAGFVAFADPPLTGVAAVLAGLHADGVELKVLTGDNELVARHVCTQIGLAEARIVLGSELDRIDDIALGVLAERTTVFARVSPEQKNRVILALKHRGHVVGYLGDGINDAPSLHAADVGISVAGAVDVARDAADIILRERSLVVLHQGILHGRKAFGNVMKYLLMGTSSNFGNMLSMAAAPIVLPFLPMLPTQILLNNFLYDLAQVTIPTDNVDASFIRKPRHWDIGLIRTFMLVIGPVSSVYDYLTFWVLRTVFHADERLFQTGWFVESLTTQTLVLFIIRTAGNPLRSRPSRPLTVTTLGVVLVGIVLPFTPLAHGLGFTPLPVTFFPFLVGAVSTYLGCVEVVKRRVMGRLMR
jgi:Mg2+-importing ATPase